MEKRDALLCQGVLFIILMFGAGCARKLSLARKDTVPFVLEKDLAWYTVGKSYISAVGGVYRGFTAHLYGAWDDDVFTLVEDFVYSDRVKERKAWRFAKLNNGLWSGTRENVVGQAKGLYRQECLSS